MSDSVQIALNGASGEQVGQISIKLLKKSQDLAKSEAAQMLATLPPPARSANPPGIGQNLDIMA